MKVDVYNQNRDKVSEAELNEEVFGAEVREHLLYAAVRYQLAKRRQGTHKTKTRAEVSGGGKKPFRQKGTGRARAGTTRAAQWRGGGVVFGRVPRDYSVKMNKKARRAALISALSRRVEENKLVVVDKLEFADIKTKHMVQFINTFELSNALVVLPERETVVCKSARNLPEVTVLPAEGLNVYDILYRENLVMTQAAIDAVCSRLGR